jgi:hypothetical protein
LVRWRAPDLARESSVGVATIRRAELTDGETSMTAANDLAVRRALEAAGVEFIDDHGRWPGCTASKASERKAGQLNRSSVKDWSDVTNLSRLDGETNDRFIC